MPSSRGRARNDHDQEGHLDHVARGNGSGRAACGGSSSPSSALNVLGTDFTDDTLATSDATLGTDLGTLGGDAEVLSTAFGSGLPSTSAYTALANDAKVLDQECGYAADTF